MKTGTVLSLLTLTFLAVSPLAMSQTPAALPGPTEQTAAMPVQGMDKMADSVTKMSEMCMTMMEKEKAAMPCKFGAGLVVGVLLFVALVLFIVLEIQWIKYWSALLERPSRPEERIGK